MFIKLSWYISSIQYIIFAWTVIKAVWKAFAQLSKSELFLHCSAIFTRFQISVQNAFQTKIIIMISQLMQCVLCTIINCLECENADTCNICYNNLRFNDDSCKYLYCLELLYQDNFINIHLYHYYCLQLKHQLNIILLII